MLVLKTLLFRLLDLALDPDGSNVIINAKIHSLTWTIFGLYLPPPASLLLLNQIPSKMVEFASDNTVILGHFNLVPDSGIDRMSSMGQSCSGLVAWVDTYGLTGVWRWRNPRTQAFTCYSVSHRTFSRIDPVLPRVMDIKILPREISDHAPLLLTLDLPVAPTDRLWRLSRFWVSVSDTVVDALFRTEMTGYWAVNPGSAAAKTNTRGHNQTIITRICMERRAELTGGEKEAANEEALFP